MPTTFLHMADVHLGYRQYQSQERVQDFSRAFERAVEDAIARQVDFVIIAGDLFHKAAINPITLLQAKQPLDRLRAADIPAIAINGNHDGSRYGSHFSWLDYLEADGCLTVLKPSFSKGGRLELTPSNGRRGGYLDLNGVRVIGLHYLGASTPAVLTELPAVLEQLPPTNHFTVLMAHFGLEGEVPHLNGAIGHHLLAPLKPHINYLALGHVHKPVEREGWIYNPGSLEACGIDERRWRGGWFHVTVEAGQHETQHIKSKRRPMHRLKVEVDGHTTPTALYEAVRAELQAHQQAMSLGHLKPVVQVWLEGVFFDRHDLDTGYIEEMIVEMLDPLKALVRNNTRSTEHEVVLDERLDRAALERAVLAELAGRDSRYQYQAKDWAELMLEIKRMVLTGQAPAAVATAISKRAELLKQAEAGAETADLKAKLGHLKAALADTEDMAEMEAEMETKMEAENVD